MAVLKEKNPFQSGRCGRQNGRQPGAGSDRLGAPRHGGFRGLRGRAPGGRRLVARSAGAEPADRSYRRARRGTDRSGGPGSVDRQDRNRITASPQ